jgi:hypothetical protein
MSGVFEPEDTESKEERIARMRKNFIWDDSDVPPEMQAHRVKFEEISKRFVAMFSRVRPGFPWWFWCEREDGSKFVIPVRIDGSNNLWADVKGHGCNLVEYLIKEHVKVLCAVEEPK